jgi:hypothetical protein
VGARGDDDSGSNSGSAYVFVRSGENWLQQQKLTASDSTTNDYFGYSVSISGNSVVVGAVGGADNGHNSGKAYVFVRSGTNWTQQKKLTVSDGAAGDFFGCSVGISDETLVVGAYGDDDNGEDSGSAYVFVRIWSSWNKQAKLMDIDGVAGDFFGFSVAISGNSIAVGADGDDDNGEDSGSTHVFVRDERSWSHQAKLMAADGAAGKSFGYSVSLSGDRIVAGAYGDDDNGRFAGSVYLFERRGAAWGKGRKVRASDGAAGDCFGYAVAISDSSMIVGAHNDDDYGENSGSAYMFALGHTYNNDYDGDDVSDLAVLDQGTGRWFVRAVGGRQIAFDINWGWAGVEGVAGDYDGDGLADLAVFDQGTGRWFIRKLSGAQIVWQNFWGWPGVRPVAGDYDGDGVSDLAVFDQATGRWFIKKTDDTILGNSINWGWAGVVPVSGDYDGDGKADLAVFDRGTGRWFIRAMDGTQIASNLNWGWAGVDPVAGDYDGDGKSDLAVFDQASGRWFIQSVDGRQLGFDINWGWPGVRPVSGDFNGDGADDLAIFDEATGRWFIQALDGTQIAWDANWGWPGVQPVGK